MSEEFRGFPYVAWSMCCDHFLLDAGGKYSMIGVFERVGAASFPATHKVMFVVSQLIGLPGATANTMVTIWGPDETIVLSTPESQVRFSPEGRTLLVNLLYDVNFPRAGTYTAVVEAAGKPAGELKLDVYEAQAQR
ncbi:MAG: DUF6941 family protein [Dehalococcoidia bacterium]